MIIIYQENIITYYIYIYICTVVNHITRPPQAKLAGRLYELLELAPRAEAEDALGPPIADALLATGWGAG